MAGRIKKSGPAKNLKDKNIDKAYEKYRENLVAGPSTRPSTPNNWQNPMVNSSNVIPKTPPKTSGGGGRTRIDGVGRGGGIRIGTRRGIGER